MTNDEETEIRAYVAEREAARARGEHIDSDERREVMLIAALDEARAQLAALHARASDVVRTFRGPASDPDGQRGEWPAMDTLDDCLSSLATAAAEHERGVRADERAKALREAEVMLRRRAARAFSAGATAVGLDGEVVRMHAGIYEAMVGEANALVKMADEAERRAR